MFHMIREKGNEAILEPVIPAQIRVTRVSGKSPESAVFQCEAIPSVGEGERRVNILKCVGTEYAVGDILLSKGH